MKRCVRVGVWIDRSLIIRRPTKHLRYQEATKRRNNDDCFLWLVKWLAQPLKLAKMVIGNEGCSLRTAKQNAYAVVIGLVEMRKPKRSLVRNMQMRSFVRYLPAYFCGKASRSGKQVDVVRESAREKIEERVRILAREPVDELSRLNHADMPRDPNKGFCRTPRNRRTGTCRC